jgi:ACT domain-containing protein
LNATDKSGVLAKISSIFSKHGISVAKMIQEQGDAQNENVPLIFFTHTTYENNIKKAIEAINETQDVAKVVSVIRVVS